MFIDPTGTLGQIFIAFTAGVTGNVFATMFILFLFFLAVCLLFGLPLDLAMIILFPFAIASARYEGSFVPIVVLIVFYFTFLIARRFIFR